MNEYNGYGGIDDFLRIIIGGSVPHIFVFVHESTEQHFQRFASPISPL